MAAKGRKLRILLLFLALLILTICMGVEAGKKEGDTDGKQAKKKKDIRDYDDADMERLFMEWEEAEDEHDPDDLLEHERPPATVDLSQIDPKNPESALKLTKKGKTLMVFVSVSGNPTDEETDTITNRWQSMLFNANFQLQRYPVSSNRVIYLLNDGSLAWDMKNFLIQQDRCEEVSIEGQVYYGKGSGRKVDGKGKTIGLDDDKDAKPSKKSQPKADKQKKEKSKGKSAKSDSEQDKTDSKKDQSKTKQTKDESKESSARTTPKSDSTEDKNAGKDETLKEDEKAKEDIEEDGLPEEAFFRQLEDPDEEEADALKRDEPGYHAARAKRAREKQGGYKSAEPLVMPSKYDLENEPTKKNEQKEEL